MAYPSKMQQIAVKAADKRNTEPGNVLIVALYKTVNVGPAISGTAVINADVMAKSFPKTKERKKL